MQDLRKRIDKSPRCAIIIKLMLFLGLWYSDKGVCYEKIILIGLMLLWSLLSFAERKEASAMGFKDEIRVILDMQGGKIVSIEVQHRDPERVAGPAIQQLKQEILSKQSVDVDDIAGATATSQGMRQAVQKAMEK